MASVLRSPSPRSAKDPGRDPRRAGRAPARWIAIGLASVLLHLTVLDLLPRWSLDAEDAGADLPLTVTLLAPVVTPSAVPTAAPPVVPDVPRRVLRPKPAPAPTPTPTPAPTREPVFVPDSYEAPVAVTVPASPGTAVERPGAVTAAPPVAAAPAATAVVPEPLAPTPVPKPPPPPAVAPGSAKLFYKLVYVDAKTINPVHYYGVGSIDWTLADGRYRSDLVASYDALLFKIDLLRSHSEGAVVDAGLAPDRYTESPRKRPQVATNFNRDGRQSITFSASSVSAPLTAGAQDRLSVLFQIGALLLADPTRDARSSITVPVAGVRGDVEPWIFAVIGSESIQAGGDPLSTIHLRRAARPESGDRTIDVWIAQVAGGYPAKVLYTEANGSTIEMTLDRIGRAD